MIRLLSVLGIVAATTAGTAFAISTQHTQNATVSSRGAPVHPTVLELFQSQGCSSCPPALNVLVREADRPDVIALNFAVTYWDELGWKDRFAKPQFTARQWDYAHFNARPVVATPQLIVNGRGFVNGGDENEVDRAIHQFAAREPGPSIKADGKTLIIGSGKPTLAATVWLVSYDPRILRVPIGAGENAGRTLPHRNIVKDLIKLGSWQGSAQQLMLPAVDRTLKRVVLVQTGTGGPIIAASPID
ncbi:MAG TPA: DUF1223 domain-containing protein [Sphingomicrobium sp.]|nr:DUF1223 domain-containing protein [Sphingomicrobium sp.]